MSVGEGVPQAFARTTVLQLAVGVSLLMIVERRGVLHEQGVLASDAHNPQLAQTVFG